MKVIVQIPCYNEESTLPLTVRNVPREVLGVDSVEILVIDDGSRDRTAEVAREAGVEHIVRFAKNRGLAAAFAAGIDTCLRLGADIIVNTDADNQYAGADIPLLIQPILEGRADVVIGDRQVATHPEFSRGKILLQQVGSWVVRQASGTDIPDTTSGFRAYSREGALNLNVITDYSYTLETIIQAGKKRIPMTSVPVRTNPRMRRSRLVRTIPSYVGQSMATIVRLRMMYGPLQVLARLASLVFALGLLLLIRYGYYVYIGEGIGHVQSVIVAGALLVLGFQTFVLGLTADLISINRRLNEDLLYRVKRLESDLARCGAVEPTQNSEHSGEG